MTWLVSCTATPAHSPNCGCGSPIARPMVGYRKTAERPEQGDRGHRVGDLAGPGADDRRRGDDRGVAHTAEPTAISNPSRPSIRTKRAAIRTMTNDSDIVTRISPVAGSPIRAISPRLRRAPSRTMPKRRTRCEAKARPGRSGASRGPAIAATTMPSSRAIVTSATIEGKNKVTRRAAAATATAAASPGAIDRTPRAAVVPWVRTARGGREPRPAPVAARGGRRPTARR